ncbi:MAG: fumarate hydratase, partial [Lachnospiraceae bacterium]|nr:fumarate hydratase [Lachnospiraceae bacterium]
MRAIHSDEITKNVREMCIQANLILSDDVESRILGAGEKEDSSLGKRILGQLKENLEIAKNDQIPI